MGYRIVIKKSAEKEIEQLPQKMAERIVLAINELAENPRPFGSKKLKGEDDLYRIRVGDYRVIYSIQDKVLVVEVVKVGHRKDVYE